MNRNELARIRHDLSSILGGYRSFGNALPKGLNEDALKLYQQCTERLHEFLISIDQQISTPSVAVAKKRRVFLQFAMRIEANPLIEALQAKETPKPEWSKGLPFAFYEAEFGELSLTIGIAGVDSKYDVDSIGSVPAAVLAELVIRYLKPDLILNAGTCGGFQEKAHEIAQVFIGSKYVAFHHRRSSIPAMRDYGIGKYPVANSDALRNALNLPEGVVTSGDALDYSAEDRDYIAANGGTLKEMEAAAIGWVAGLHGVPLLPIKTVTDFVDHPADTAKQFMVNYGKSVENLKTAVVRVLGYLSDHPEDQVWG